MKRYLFIGLLCLVSVWATAQKLPAGTQVSLITCGPGDDLYATFGHTAIHFYNPATGLDRIYNYGTFDFDTPNFYLKFAQGKLNYQLTVSTLERFLRVYVYEGRWVYRQELNLTPTDKEALYDYLEWNALPENRDYPYDFFYDNCSTRPRDVLEKVLEGRLRYPNAAQDTVATFRQMIDLYLTNHPWSDLGIDLALGIPCDKRAGYREKMFLPDYLMAGMATAEVSHSEAWEPLILREGYILNENPTLRAGAAAGIAWIFWSLFGICLLTSLLGNPDKMRWFDVGLFSIVGLLGIMIALLWWATDHSATKWNMNLLWALPTFAYGAVLLAMKKPVGRFFKIHALILFFVVISWMWIPQQLHHAAIPMILALMARSWAWQKQRHLQTAKNGHA